MLCEVQTPSLDVAKQLGLEKDLKLYLICRIQPFGRLKFLHNCENIIGKSIKKALSLLEEQVPSYLRNQYRKFYWKTSSPLGGRFLSTGRIPVYWKNNFVHNCGIHSDNSIGRIPINWKFLSRFKEPSN